MFICIYPYIQIYIDGFYDNCSGWPPCAAVKAGIPAAMRPRCPSYIYLYVYISIHAGLTRSIYIHVRMYIYLSIFLYLSIYRYL